MSWHRASPTVRRPPAPRALARARGASDAYRNITDHLASIALRPPSWAWYLGFGLSLLLTLPFLAMLALLLLQGTGIWGINIPVGWGMAIVNFGWWSRIGHAGTLISALLLVARARWRTSINRFAEAMSLFALVNAGLMPLLHLGRPWLFYWMLPYPNSMGLWPQFRSPLAWDLFAIAVYFVVSLLFWYAGLIPDLATLRDRAQGRRARAIYGALSLGWVGSATDWRRYDNAYYLLGALVLPLVVSTHTIVGLDFATSVLPGWHETISPPMFVVGALFGGFAMILVMIIPIRAAFELHPYITGHHLDNLGRLLLGLSLLATFGYLLDLFHGWYSDSAFDEYWALTRFTGFYAPLYLGVLLGGVLIPQLLWFRRLRQQPLVLFLVALSVLIANWLERFVGVVVPLHRDFLPSSWGLFLPTVWDWALIAGSFGLFFTLIFLFLRFLPVISIFEMRELVFVERVTEDDE